MISKSLCFLLSTSAALLLPVCSARSRNLTKADARELVAAALGPRIRELPHCGLDDFQSYDPKRKECYLFEASFSNPGGMQVVGHYAVHKVNGDVWKLIVCEKVESEELHRLQLPLRRRIGATSSEMRRVGGESPC